MIDLLKPMSQHKYRIYPSILDKYQKFLDSELVAEEFWNKDSDDNYKLTPDEMSDMLEQELIDSINRVERVASEAADKGTAFNEIVDCILENRGTERNDILLHSTKEDIKALFNDWDFSFDINLCKNVALYFWGCIPQYTCSAILPTAYGDVELYGHVDYIGINKIFDLKTTKQYQFGNYSKYWQRHLYPYCLIESGEMEEVDEFEFTVVKWQERKNKPISGEIFKEVYTYSHDKSKEQLTAICESFIEWLEMHRDVITDQKIFGGDNAA